MIKCACGCGKSRPEKGYDGKPKKFIPGHNAFLRIGDKNPNFGWTPPNYKGVIVTKFGYTKIHSPNHPFRDSQDYVMKHRLVMEKHLGRYLSPEEKVHHIIPILKGGTDDIENLMLFPNHSQHRSYEMKKDMSNRFCKYCNGKTYITKRGHEQWYGNEINGWVCRRCNVKKLTQIIDSELHL